MQVYLKRLMTTKIITKETTSADISDNIILIDKPAGWTSFDVVKKIKNIGRFKKVGHAGTLDPFATGLLILGTNKETKNLSEYSNSSKEYVAQLVFGETKDTYDLTGETVSIARDKIPGEETVRNIVKDFIGPQDQVPPMYSAKKVDGVRLYKLARKGREIEREPSRITIFEIKELSFSPPELEIYIKCSKGTYIRSLAHDIGVRAGCGAYLNELRRLAIDDFDVKDAMTISEFEHFWRQLN